MEIGPIGLNVIGGYKCCLLIFRYDHIFSIWDKRELCNDVGCKFFSADLITFMETLLTILLLHEQFCGINSALLAIRAYSCLANIHNSKTIGQ